MKHTNRLLLVVLAIGSTSLIGCSPSGRSPTARVLGEVTLDGKPLKEAVIVFQPESGRSAYGSIKDGQIVDVGTYDTSDGVILGKTKIAIQPSVKEGPMTMLRPTDGPGGPGGGGGSYMGDEAPVRRKVTIPKGAIPRHYRNPSSSDLVAEIVKGENFLKLELTSE